MPPVPWLGFYAEDFFFAYVAHFFGTEGLVNSLSIDRPFNGYLAAFNYFTLNLGNNVLIWHLWMFTIRLLGGYTLFFLLQRIWPNRLAINTIISTIFLIYPGFLEQALPLGYNIYPVGLLFWTVSVIFSVEAIKSKRQVKKISFTFASIFFEILTLLNLEFFIGLEILRFLLILSILKIDLQKNLQSTASKLKTHFRSWSPYTVAALLFVIWRILVFNGTRPETDISFVTQTYYTNFWWILKIPWEILSGFLSALIFVFFVPLVINFLRLPLANSLIAGAIGLAAAVLTYLCLHRLNLKPDKKFGRNLIFIGFVSIIGAQIPIILSGRVVSLINGYDRYTITSIFGVATALVGFCLYKLPKSTALWFISALVFLAITSNLLSGFYRVDNWQKQQSLWWQLMWRSPKILPNALLVLDFAPASQNLIFKDLVDQVKWNRFYWVDEQIWSAGNLFFNSNTPTQDHFVGDFLEDQGVLNKIKNQSAEGLENRTLKFTRDYKKTVIIKTPNDSSCLWVLDKNRPELPENYSQLLKSSIPYSDINNLVRTSSAATPPRTIFGPEPAKNWCYYFQKASLARQSEDFETLNNLTNEVFQKGLNPQDPNEWLPMIEGLLISQKYSEAENIINGHKSQTFIQNLCQMKQRLQTDQIKLNCPN